MGLTKTEIFSEKQNRLASMMKALAHPARMAIIQHLIKILCPETLSREDVNLPH